MNAGIYVLAAGQSRRFGKPKLDVPCAGRPLGSWIITAIRDAGLAPGVIIVPPEIPRFASEAQLHGWTLVINDDAEHGLSTSMVRAIQYADETAQDAACIFLADMPLITAGHVRSIVAADQLDRPVATPHPDGRLGVPARLPRTMFAALTTATSDTGASALLAKAPSLRAITAFTDLRDVDTPADMEQAETLLIQRMGHSDYA